MPADTATLKGLASRSRSRLPANENKISGQCEVPSCQMKVRSRGLCRGHYSTARMRIIRTPAAELPKLSRDEAFAFIRKAQTANTFACIDWPMSATVNDYGRINLPKGYILAHQQSCMMAHGLRPEGVEVAHSCARPCCVNPRHLSWKTHKANMEERDYDPDAPSFLTEEAERQIKRYAQAPRPRQRKAA